LHRHNAIGRTMKNERFIRNIIIGVLFFITVWFGIRPIISGEEFERRVKKAKGPSGRDQYSFVVFGTEPEGIAAALSAARMGLKTILITEDPDAGSYIKSGLITYTSPDYAVINGKKKRLNNGIYAELFGDTGGNFAINDYINAAAKMLEKEPNLTVLYDAGFLSAEISENIVEGIKIYHNGETRLIEAPIFLDATEDGKILSLCNVPYFTGSADLNVPNAYIPVEYNFMISNVKWKDLENIRKQAQDIYDFETVLRQYEKHSAKTKISNLKFIEQSENDIVISGIRMHQVNVDDPEKLAQDFNDALTEAKLLTAFLRYAFIPFADCTFKTGPAKFHIPEYRHFQGKYRLRVEDILENRDFRNKIVMASAPVDGEKFVSSELSEEYSYIIGNPTVYSIPLDCFISVNLDNLLMVGKKASYSSLAATSAGRMAVSITSGEALGITAAYCYLNDLTPVELSTASDQTIAEFHNMLKRARITLDNFDIPNPNEGHWAWPSVKVLTEYGLLAGGIDNDYLFDMEAYQENLTTLIINLLVKAAPEKYSLELDSRIRAYANGELLTGEKAAEILLKAKSIPFDEGDGYWAALENGLIPETVIERMDADSIVTLDCVYVMTVHIVNMM
jgi:hypothetical protein